VHYPFWCVPGLAAPMLIALVAVFHIFVSLYAGGPSSVFLFDPIFQGLAIALIAGEIASTSLSRTLCRRCIAW